MESTWKRHNEHRQENATYKKKSDQQPHVTVRKQKGRECPSGYNHCNITTDHHKKDFNKAKYRHVYSWAYMYNMTEK